MNKILCVLVGAVMFCAFEVQAKSSSDVLGASTYKQKTTTGVTNKSSDPKSGVGLTNPSTRSKVKTKVPKTNTTLPGSSKKGTTDPLSGKSGSKIR